MDAEADERLMEMQMEIERLRSAMHEADLRIEALTNASMSAIAEEDGGDPGNTVPPASANTPMVVLGHPDAGVPGAWSYDAEAQAFASPYVLLGNVLDTVGAPEGNANITLPQEGSGTSVDYYIHVTHGTSGTPDAELVTQQGANDDSDTYIWVARLDETGQSGGLRSVPCIPLYAW